MARQTLTGFRLGLALMGAAATAHGEVRLHNLFSDNMVLLRDVPVPIWGWAEDGEDVTVQFRDQTVTTQPVGGLWVARLKKLKAGGPERLEVTGRNSLVLTNILVGEVWIASGQSNMEWPLRAAYEAEKEIAASANSMVRLFTVPKLKADAPVRNINGSWETCQPLTASNFSAVAYYFARDLQTALRVPVGIIHTSWGGSPAEVWISEKTLSSSLAYKLDVLDAYLADLKVYQTNLIRFEQQEAEAKKEGKPFTEWRPRLPWKPTELYNGMIAPLIPYAIKGAIWYQGESNAGRAWQYRTLFADMIKNWRSDWGQGDFPFLEVQLAPFMQIKGQPGDSAWAELREAQAFVTKILPKVGMAVITDVGEENDIHPQKKEPVGARLALAARSIAYGEEIVYSGPTYKSMKVKGDRAIISFDHVGSGLEARTAGGRHFAVFSADGNRLIMTNSPQAVRIWDARTGPLTNAVSSSNSNRVAATWDALTGRPRLVPIVSTNSLTNANPSVIVGTSNGGPASLVWDSKTGRLRQPLLGFSIAGGDQKFVWAQAVIQGDQVVVNSPEVRKPVAVRYGWADYPVVNLWNADGLPASPFRTDNFPITTQPKK